MGKSDAEILELFNEQVNMTADELEAWLDDPQSGKAGTGVGVESGRRIVEILRKNPERKSDGYDKEDIAHIRKVVSYNSRHLAQEDHLKETKTTAELEEAKSTISLRNWGHDPVKVKLQRESQGSPSDIASGVDGGGNSNGNGGDADADGGTSQDQGREPGSEEDADGEADPQASSSNSSIIAVDSESDEPFENVATGRKRRLRRHTVGVKHSEHGGRGSDIHGKEEAGSGETGNGRNKRLHREEE